MKKFFALPVLVLLFAALSQSTHTQEGGNSANGAVYGARNFATLRAAELFRIGLESYNRFAFNETILSLEQALSFLPDEPLLLDYLGRAYYRSGLERIALRQWQAALMLYSNDAAETLMLNSRI